MKTLFSRSFAACTFVIVLLLFACSKNKDSGVSDPTFSVKSVFVDNATGQSTYKNVSTTASIRLKFDESLNQSTVAGNIGLHDYNLVNVPVNYSYADDDSSVI